MRAFLGMPIPETVAGEIFERIAGLRGDLQGIKWVKPGNYHITVLFLGDIDENECARVEAAMDVLTSKSCTQATLSAVGQFPPRGNPRVVYAGLASGEECCQGVFAQICNALPGYACGRTYTPHITLGRVRRGSRVVFHGNSVVLPRETFVLNEVVLYRSILRQTGAEYTRLHTKVLGI